MDYIAVVSIVALVNETLDISNIATVSDTAITEVKQCYRQGAFSFGTCDMSEINDSVGLSYSWFLVNILFAAIFLNPTVRRRWKALAFLSGLPGTLLIAAFMELFSKKA